MRLKFILMVFLTLLAVIGAAGCAGSTSGFESSADAAEEPAGSGKSEAVLKIAMVTDVGGINDNSFNQLAWEGLLKAQKELRIEAGYKESRGEEDYLPNITSLAEENFDLIWGIGFLTASSIQKGAEENQAKRFAVIDYKFGNIIPANLMSVSFREEEAAFLVGYIAGKMTKMGKVGFIGGIDSEVIHKFQYGYKAGAAYADPGCKFLEEYSGTFSDPEVGRAVALKMYGSGADIIFHAAGECGNGLIEAAKETGKFMIGVDRDQSEAAPENVITSAIKKVDHVIYDIAKDLKAGHWNGGLTVEYGLAEGGVDIAASSYKKVPRQILDEVEEIRIKIITGTIKVPKNAREYDALRLNAS